MKRTISEADTVRLVLLAQQGDNAAAEELLLAHFGLIRRVLKNPRRPETHLEIEDLEQEGRLGLLEAIKHFKPERGAKFSTFATWRIYGRVKRALRHDGLILLPTDRTFEEEGKMPRVAMSLDARLADGRNMAEGGHTAQTFGDYLQAPDDTEAEIIARLDAADLRAMVDEIPIRERTAISLHYGLDGEGSRTLKEIATLLGCSSSQSHNLVARGLRRLRALAREKGERP